jgi:hypothetical protein
LETTETTFNERLLVFYQVVLLVTFFLIFKSSFFNDPLIRSTLLFDGGTPKEKQDFLLKFITSFGLIFVLAAFKLFFFLFVCTILAFAIVEITDRGMKLEK